MGILKEILKELILTRRELQAIRSNLESSKEISIEPTEISKVVRKANHGND